MANAPGTSRDNPLPRPAARVVLLDPRDRVLMLRAGFPGIHTSDIWITPGGGLNEDETYEEAAIRELWEETGLSGVPLGPLIWTRRHVALWDDTWIQSIERFYVVRTDYFTVSPSNVDEAEGQYLKEKRWWSLPEIMEAIDEETFVPRRLQELLPPIIAGDIPEIGT